MRVESGSGQFNPEPPKRESTEQKKNEKNRALEHNKF